MKTHWTKPAVSLLKTCILALLLVVAAHGISRADGGSSDGASRDDGRVERRYLGAGLFANTVNFSAGPTVIVWPLENLAIQGSVGYGTYISQQVRAFYRFNVSKVVNPYVGAGYLHVRKDENVDGLDTTLKTSGGTFFVGDEIPLLKNLAAYAEVSLNPLNPRADVTVNGRKLRVTSDYNHVDFSVGIVFYPF